MKARRRSTSVRLTPPTTSPPGSCFFFFAIYLEFEKIPRGCCEIDCTGFRHNDVVLDADAPDPIEIDAWFYSHYHAFLKNGFFAPANARRSEEHTSELQSH